MRLGTTSHLECGRSMNINNLETMNRRHWFGMALGGVATLASGAYGRTRSDDEVVELILRGKDPLNAETPASTFVTYFTPNSHFFVRSHFGAPAVGLRPWSLRIEGLGTQPRDMSIEDLNRHEQVTLPAVLQCAGNGRGNFSPTIPGVGWQRGGVGNAEWSGVRLADLLDQQLRTNPERDQIKHVQFLGADLPPNPKTPAFFRSLPIARALDPTTLIATRMNGEPIPALHGGPVRLIVPRWTGNHWIKWVRTIRLARDEAPGFYQQTGYKIPRDLSQPPATLKPEDLVPVTLLNVKSLIARPTEGALIHPGQTAIRGVAWTGDGRIATVEVAVDDQPWKAATLEGPDHEGAWRLWSFAWNAAPGKHRIRARATDTSGASQPIITPWNKSGYLWNAIETVNLEVRNS